MSRIGLKPIDLPAGTTVTLADRRVTVKGPLGELWIDLPAGISARIEDAQVRLARADDAKRSRAFHGLARALVANMVEGVSRGYRRELELQGVGFRGAMQANKLVMSLGFSHPVEFTAPAGVTIEVKESRIAVSGPDKQQVGNVAARLRAFHPPEPYQGKGVRYVGERVRRKAGKTVS